MRSDLALKDQQQAHRLQQQEDTAQRLDQLKRRNQDLDAQIDTLHQHRRRQDQEVSPISLALRTTKAETTLFSSKG